MVSMRARLSELENERLCSICIERPKDCAFQCGHRFCRECARSPQLTVCPLCRAPVTQRIVLYWGLPSENILLAYWYRHSELDLLRQLCALLPNNYHMHVIFHVGCLAHTLELLLYMCRAIIELSYCVKCFRFLLCNDRIRCSLFQLFYSTVFHPYSFYFYKRSFEYKICTVNVHQSFLSFLALLMIYLAILNRYTST